NHSRKREVTPKEEKSLQLERKEEEDLPKESIPEGEDPPKGRYFGGYFSGEDTPKEIKKTTPRKQ
ncbi:18336_t:CDS:2, partial [Racocetra persica]